MIKIRKFEEKDAEEASNLIRKAILEVNSKDYPLDVIKNLYEFFSTEHLMEMAIRDEILLAVDNGKIRGTIRLKKNAIHTVFVDPDFHNQGIGSKLMNAAEQLAKENNYSQVGLSSAINAIGFYEKLGYILTKEMYEDELGITYLMVKEL